MKLVLASSSPRRAEILRNAGFEFHVQPSNVDETRLGGERAEDYVRRLANTKAQFAARHATLRGDAAIVVGADTAVLVDDHILGKPADPEDARRMLRLLRGRDHYVLTGLSLIETDSGVTRDLVEKTRVTFLPLSDSEIEFYVGTGEPFDKAGAYGIQGIGGRFISRIEGCYFNVMGLPVSKLSLLLRAMGWSAKGQAASQK